MSSTSFSSDESTHTEPELSQILPELITDSSIDISPSKNNSILKQVLKEGSGRNPMRGDTVYVHYTGTLPNGKKFDSSYDRDSYFSFQVGSGKVIKSWDLCVRSMKKGEQCMLVTSAKYGYGKRGHGDVIPPSSNLCFKIELFDFHGEDVTPEKNGLVLRSLISKGSGYLVPRDRSKVRISYLAKSDGHVVLENNDLEFEIGAAEDKNLPEGVELAVRFMKKGEQSLFILKHPFSCRVYETDDISSFPEDYQLECTITLKEFTEIKQVYEMNSEEKIETATYIKDRGNFFFRRKCHNTALRWYDRGKDYLEDWDVNSLGKNTPSGISPEQMEQRNQAIVSLFLNISLSNLKLRKFRACIEAADQACKIDSKSVKGHLRAGKAFCELKEFDLAFERLNLAKEIGGNSEEIRKELQCARQMRNEYKEKERAIFKNAFNKLTVDRSNGA